MLICAGGTGGGVSPALAVLDALREADATLRVLWVGGEGGMEARLVERTGTSFRAIPAAGIHGVGVCRLPLNLWRLGRGYLAARRILRGFRPDVLFFTGGYLAAPVALAGRRIPVLLYTPDIEPGLALRFLVRFADCIATTTPESRAYFPANKVVVTTGYPVRRSLAKWDRVQGRAALSLREDAPVLLITGGSRGARSINRAVLAHLPALLEIAQVVHVSGELDWPMVEDKAREVNSPRYRAFPYLHEEMGAALAAADLVLSRAGASTLGEYPLFGLPAVLVPYPYAWRYQKVNAAYLVRHGAAVMVEDGELTARLLPTVRSLLEDPPRLESMRLAMKRLHQPQAATEIARQLLALGEGR